ncbi:MAG: hypothetical protein Q9162_000966 [Coniocarpon cinnabarinum]
MAIVSPSKKGKPPPAVEIHSSTINWNGHKKAVANPLTRYSKPGSVSPQIRHVRVTMISVKQLAPRSECDDLSTPKDGQVVCSNIQQFRSIVPSQIAQDPKDSVNVLDDLCVSFASIFYKFIWPHHAHRYTNTSFEKLPRFESSGSVDKKEGHFENPALVRVDGKLYVLVLNGDYVLCGYLATQFAKLGISTQVRPDPDIPFFSALDVEIELDWLKDGTKCFDDDFNLTYDQYKGLFNQAQMNRKKGVPAKSGSSYEDPDLDDQPDTPSTAANRPRRNCGPDTYNYDGYYAPFLRKAAAVTKSNRKNRASARGPNTTPKASTQPVTKDTGVVAGDDSGSDEAPIAAKRRRRSTATQARSAAPSPTLATQRSLSTSILPTVQETQLATPFQTPNSSIAPTPLLPPPPQAVMSVSGTPSNTGRFLHAHELRPLIEPFRGYLPEPLNAAEMNGDEKVYRKALDKYADVKKMLDHMLRAVKEDILKPYESSLQDMKTNVEMRRLSEKMHEG